MWIEIIEGDTCRYHIPDARFLAMSPLESRAHKLQDKLGKHAVFESMNDYGGVENSAPKGGCGHCSSWINRKRVLFDQALNGSRSGCINKIEAEAVLVVINIRNAPGQTGLWDHEPTGYWGNCGNMQFSEAIFRNMDNCDGDENSTSKKVADIALSALVETPLYLIRLIVPVRTCLQDQDEGNILHSHNRFGISSPRIPMEKLGNHMFFGSMDDCEFHVRSILSTSSTTDILGAA